MCVMKAFQSYQDRWLYLNNPWSNDCFLEMRTQCSILVMLNNTSPPFQSLFARWDKGFVPLQLHIIRPEQNSC